MAKDRDREVFIIGASRGLGRALASIFYRDGYQVTGTYSGTVQPPKAANVEWIRCDLADASSRQSALETLLPVPRYIVFAAAFDPRFNKNPNTNVDSMTHSLIVNGSGGYHMLKMLMDNTVDPVSIAIINSESIYAPDAQSAGYAAGKAALKVFAAGLSDACRGSSSAVFEVILGPVDSDDRRADVAAASAKFGIAPEDVVARALARANPELRIHRFIKPEECAIVLKCGFELAEEANGASFRLDGGAGGAFR